MQKLGHCDSDCKLDYYLMLNRFHNQFTDCEFGQAIRFVKLSPFLLQILAIQRHMVDPSGRNMLPEAYRSFSYLYDVVVSDGVTKMKLLLSPKLNRLVETGAMRELSIVAMDQLVAVLLDDSSVIRYYILNDVQVLETKVTYLILEGGRTVEYAQLNSFVGRIRFLERLRNETRITCAIPLIGRRLHYMPRWNQDGFPAYVNPHVLTPSTIAWSKSPVLADRIDSVCGDHKIDGFRMRNMQEVVQAKKRNSKTSCYLVGIVQSKNNIVHYGQPDRANSLPLKFEILLKDQTSSMRVSFWGSACIHYFYTIFPGDAIAIRQFKISSFENKVEVKVNYNRRSDHEILHLKANMYSILGYNHMCSPTYHGIQAVKYNLRKTLEISNCTESPEPFDILGRLSYVENIYRERRPMPVFAEDLENDVEPGTTSIPFFLEYRYIKVFDASCQIEIPIKLYCHSQTYCFQALQAGDIVLISNVILQVENSGIPIVTSSVSTELLLETEVRKLYKPQMFTAIRKSAELHSCIQQTDVAEDLCTSLLFRTVSLSELDNISSTLTLNESVSLIVCGHIMGLALNDNHEITVRLGETLPSSHRVSVLCMPWSILNPPEVLIPEQIPSEYHGFISMLPMPYRSDSCRIQRYRTRSSKTPSTGHVRHWLSRVLRDVQSIQFQFALRLSLSEQGIRKELVNIF